MKVLLIHTNYKQQGGEDGVFLQERDLLMESEEVRVITFQNPDGWKGLFLFLRSVWNTNAANRIKKEIREFQPDIVHMHNWHFAIGPLAIRIINKCKIPLILTIHNYRMLCPSATLLKNGEIITDSVNRLFPWQAIVSKVYRNSIILTFWLSFITRFHKKIGTWNSVSKFIVLTDFAKQIFGQSYLELPGSRFEVKPNFVPKPLIAPIPRGNSFLFVGRLSEEKGITTLIEAFKNVDYELQIAGDGPLKDLVVEASHKYTNITYLGSLDKGKVQEAMLKCSALVFPSIWYEGMPMTLIEAFSLGTPVIASNIGAMSQMIVNNYNGLHFNFKDSQSLIDQLGTWSSLTENEKVQYSKNAIKIYNQFYTSEKNKEKLLSIYQSITKDGKTY